MTIINQSGAIKKYVDTQDAKSVHKTGAETVAGAKTFTSSITSPELKRGYMCSPNADASAKPYYKIVSMKAPASSFPQQQFCALIRVSSDWGTDQPSTAVFGVLTKSNATAVQSLVLSRLPGAFDPESKLTVDRFSAIYKSTGEVEIYFKQPVNQNGFFYSLEDAGTRTSGTIPYSNITFYSNPSGVASIPTDGWTAVQCVDYANHLAMTTPSNAVGNEIVSARWVNTASTVVHTTGRETIAGTKTFSNPIITKQATASQYGYRITSVITDRDTAPTSNLSTDLLRFEDSNGLAITGHTIDDKADGSKESAFYLRHLKNNVRMGLHSDGTNIWGFCPTTPTNATGREIATASWCNSMFARDIIFDTDSDGLVPHPTTAGAGKFLRADGTWATPSTSGYTLPTASASTLGGVKIGSGLNISSGVLSNGWSKTSTVKNASLVGSAKNVQQASYITISNGSTPYLKVMWGHYRADRDTYTITFPTAFTSAWSYSIIATNDDYNYNSTSSKRSIQERTATSCKIWSEKYEGLWIAVGY